MDNPQHSLDDALVAAAPRLCAALESLVALDEAALSPEIGVNCDADAHDAAITEARAAIAQARRSTHSFDNALVEKVARAIYVAQRATLGMKPTPDAVDEAAALPAVQTVARAALEAAGVAELRAIIYMTKYAESATSEETGWRLTDVEITPAMVGAGYDVYLDCLDELETGAVTGAEMLTRAFRAMCEAAEGKRLARVE